MTMKDTDVAAANTAPLVSVVISAYNRPDYLQSAIASVLSQTVGDYEIIVVDDCSPVSLETVLGDITFPVRYHRLAQNSGANKARNEGVRLAQGCYVAFLDDDDAWLPRKLEWQLPQVQEATACIGGYEYMDTHQPFVKRIQQVTQEMLKRGNPYCGMSGLICEREWLLKHPFDEALSNGQDWDIFVRLSQQAPLRYVARPLFLYRRGSHESITTKVKKLGLADMEKRLGAVRKHRHWLGESNYRLRVAQILLGYIGNRKNPAQFVWAALRQGGAVATGRVLWEKFGNFIRRGG